MTREEILKGLEEQYKLQFSGNGYPEEFKPHGAMTECNHGGKLLIFSDDCSMCVVWSDWGDNAIDHELKECEIETYWDPETGDYSSGFVVNDTFYELNNFMKI